MKKTIQLLKSGFESSSMLTPEFAQFARTFKREFTKELESVGATDVQISRGHFYLSGFYTINGQVWYFSTDDVRWGQHSMHYRTAKNYSDYTGGSNHWIDIKMGMAMQMHGT